MRLKKQHKEDLEKVVYAKFDIIVENENDLKIFCKYITIHDLVAFIDSKDFPFNEFFKWMGVSKK